MSDEIDSIPEIPPAASAIAPGTPDRNGVPFDPSRHISKKHPVTGRWMPRGGRKPKIVLPSSSSTSSPPVGTDLDTKAPSMPSPPSPADSPAEIPAPAPSFADIERAAGPAAPPVNPSAAPDENPAPGATFEIVESADDIAEIVSMGIYNLAGFVFDAPDEWALSGTEHGRARKAIAAYVRSKGGTISAGKSLVLLAVAYTLRGLSKPKSRIKAREWTAKIRAALFAKKAPSAPAVVIPRDPPSPPAPPQADQPEHLIAEFAR